jgi:hypothetical protein
VKPAGIAVVAGGRGWTGDEGLVKDCVRVGVEGLPGRGGLAALDV